MKLKIIALMMVISSPLSFSAQQEGCAECKQVVDAMLSIEKRVCGMDITENSSAEVKATAAYSYAVAQLKAIPEDNRPAFIRALQVAVNCMDEQKWIKNTDIIYKDYLSRDL